jgi:hypothetical protein
MERNARDSRHPGSSSPASEEAREQGMSGNAGPQADQTPGDPGQPPQGSSRPGAQHETPPRRRQGFDAGSAPSRQGDGDPGPKQIAEGQQGIEPRSGSE